jgi:hypothetical protein
MLTVSRLFRWPLSLVAEVVARTTRTAVSALEYGLCRPASSLFGTAK